MVKGILEIAKSAPDPDALLETAREYAAVYLMAKERQKGCEGMGELVTTRAEFGDIVDKLIQYCKERKYISEDAMWDIDSVAEQIARQ